MQAQGGANGPLPTLFYDYDKDDIRRDITCVPYYWDGGVQVPNKLSQWYFGKLRYEWMKRVVTSTNDDGINWQVMRLADVYLMLAECYNQMENGDQEKAVYYINKVRNRASVNMPEINNGDSWMEARTKEEVFARIRHERAVELAAEGWSFSDMRRWGLLEEVAGPVKDIVNKKLYDRVVNERDYLWPIPQDEIDKNPNLRPNNPGW